MIYLNEIKTNPKTGHKVRCIRSENYNYDFDLVNGNFARWGKSFVDDPLMSPLGPELLDLEITTKCKGVKNVLCPYCYKSNNHDGKNMNCRTFKKIIDKVNFSGQLTQVAFGLGAHGDENPALWDMCNYLHAKDIAAAGTVAWVDPIVAQNIALHFGAVAVSYHGNWDALLNSIHNLNVARGVMTTSMLKQINIHFCIYEESFEDCKKLLQMMKEKSEIRLVGVNAIILLSLKKRGRAADGPFTPLSEEHFKELTEYAMKNEIIIGYDSCSFHKFRKVMTSIMEDDFEKFVKGDHSIEELKKEEYRLKMQLAVQTDAADPCESMLFSSYVNVDGMFYPCSFNEDPRWGFNVLTEDFEKMWLTDPMEWRKCLIENGRKCPTYEV